MGVIFLPDPRSDAPPAAKSVTVGTCGADERTVSCVHKRKDGVLLNPSAVNAKRGRKKRTSCRTRRRSEFDTVVDPEQFRNLF